MRIMLVDDHPGFRGIVKNLLQGPGMEFLECGDGDSAVQEFARFCPDLVLMDIAMKGTDGLAAAARIRGCAPHAEIVMLTQYDDPELRLAAQQAGAAGYLLKDDLSQLQDLMRVRADQAPH